MPLKNFQNIGHLQGYECCQGVLEKIDYKHDLATVLFNSERFENIPFFYHCFKDSDNRTDQGESAVSAIHGGSCGFKEADNCVFMRWVAPVTDGSPARPSFVMAREAGASKLCDFYVKFTRELDNKVILPADLYQSGDPATPMYNTIKVYMPITITSEIGTYVDLFLVSKDAVMVSEDADHPSYGVWRLELMDELSNGVGNYAEEPGWFYNEYMSNRVELKEALRIIQEDGCVISISTPKSLNCTVGDKTSPEMPDDDAYGYKYKSSELNTVQHRAGYFEMSIPMWHVTRTTTPSMYYHRQLPADYPIGPDYTPEIFRDSFSTGDVPIGFLAPYDTAYEDYYCTPELTFNIETIVISSVPFTYRETLEDEYNDSGWVINYDISAVYWIGAYEQWKDSYCSYGTETIPAGVAMSMADMVVTGDLINYSGEASKTAYAVDVAEYAPTGIDGQEFNLRLVVTIPTREAIVFEDPCTTWDEGDWANPYSLYMTVTIPEGVPLGIACEKQIERRVSSTTAPILT